MKTLKLFSRFTVTLLLLSIIATMIPMNAFATGSIAWGAANVSAGSVRVRSGPGLTHDVLTVARQGDAVVILNRTNSEWYRVNFNGTVGYMNTPFLERERTRANFDARGRITGSNVNLRERPEQSSAVLTTASRDTVMTILGINEGWFKVQHNGVTAYVRSDFMSKTSSSTPPSGSTGGNSTSSAPANSRGRIIGSHVNLRASASTTSAVLTTVRRGSVMNVLGRSDGWTNVSHNGTTGFIRSDLIEIVDASTPLYTASAPTSPNGTLGDEISAFARTLVGLPYRWGGTSRAGFDCSGFVTYVLRNFGISVTRQSAGMFRNNGVAISRSELAPGDLVFFGRNGNVNHVGLYIGGGQFVHASTARTGVIITNLSSRTNFIGARRVL